MLKANCLYSNVFNGKRGYDCWWVRSSYQSWSWHKHLTTRRAVRSPLFHSSMRGIYLISTESTCQSHKAQANIPLPPTLTTLSLSSHTSIQISLILPVLHPYTHKFSGRVYRTFQTLLKRKTKNFELLHLLNLKKSIEAVQEHCIYTTERN